MERIQLEVVFRIIRSQEAVKTVASNRTGLFKSEILFVNWHQMN